MGRRVRPATIEFVAGRFFARSPFLGFPVFAQSSRIRVAHPVWILSRIAQQALVD
jgi:hypothetical protein